jgi:hypothetical protein
MILAAALGTTLTATTACDSGGSDATDASTAAAGTQERSAQIVSSLEGLEVLPARARWTVTTSLTPSEVREVRFILDGTRIWTDAEAPFAYGEDDAYLGTWMGSGRHRFTVRVVAADGSKTAETVVTTVRRTKRVPFYGAYGRLPPSTEGQTRRRFGKWESFTAYLYFPPDWSGVWVGRSLDHVFAYELSGNRTVWRLGPPIFRGEPGAGQVVFGWHIRGSECGPDPATYVWSERRRTLLAEDQAYEGHDLVLHAKSDQCDERRRLLEGVWESLGD